MRQIHTSLLSRRLILLLLILMPLISIEGRAQENEKIDIELKEGTLNQLLKQIEQKSHYKILYPSPQTSAIKGINLSMRRATVREILSKALAGSPLTYSIEGNLITIKSDKWNLIRGRVTDESGSPLAGARVQIKGQKEGTTTDKEGYYSLRTTSLKGATLVVSFVGMKSSEVPLKGEIINIRLRETNSELRELVVESTGYQTTEKRVSTASIVSLSGEKVLEANTSSLDNMLMGKIPGMTVMNSTSTPGAATKIRIRGVSTISGTREPLWVVDGIILDDPVALSAQEINSLDNVNLIGNAISGLNPSDIERIDILKDAAATAIYGVRAANGVIVVTTKKGRSGTTRLSYTTDITLTQRPDYKQMHLMNSLERIEVSKEIEERGLKFWFPPARVGYEGALMDLYDRKMSESEFLERVKRIEEVNTDWFDLLYRTTFLQKHNVSVSGGNERFNYYFSGAYTSNPNNVKGKGLDQYNANAKVFVRLTDKLNLNLQLRGSIQEKSYTHSSVSPYAYALRTSRAIPAYQENGLLEYYNKDRGHKQTLVYNILNEIEHTGNSISNNSMNFVGRIEYKPIKDLNLSATVGLNTSNSHNKEWFDEQSFHAATLRNTNYGTPLPSTDPTSPFVKDQCQLPYGGGLSSDFTRNTSYQVRLQAVYNWKPAMGHILSLNVGPELRSTRYNGVRSTQFGYLPDRGETFVSIDPALWPKYKELVLGHPDRITNRLSNFISVFTNLTYSYKMKYVLTYNMRADGSNKFGQDSRAKFLPVWSLSGRWNIHNEGVLRDLWWLNTLALKGSYGIQGNVSDDQTPHLIVRTGSIDQLSQEYMNFLSKLPNPNLRWERNTSSNMGLEVSLLDNRLTASVEYYHRKGTDQIISKEVSPTIGVPSMMINAGNILNKGYDIMLSAVPIQTKSFVWSINANGSKNFNKVDRGGKNDEYTYAQYLNGTAIINGNPIDAFYSYRFKGLNDKGHPTFHGLEVKEGDTKATVYDRIFARSGSRMPFIQGGFGSDFRYKNLSMSFFFSYSLGNLVRLNNLYADTGQRLPQPQDNMSQEYLKRWRRPGDEAHTNIPTLSSEELSVKNGFKDGQGGNIIFANNLWQMYNKSDLRVVSGNNLRLRSASLTYRFPKQIRKKRLPLTSGYVRLTGYNLVLFRSSALKGQDPEQVTLGSRTTPPLPSYAVSINLTF